MNENIEDQEIVKDNLKMTPEELKKEKIKIMRAILITFLATMLFTKFVIQPAVIDGSSMFPTFNNKQFVLINKLSKDYKRGDVIVFKYNGRFLVKRVIALPGETVQIIANNIYINDEKIDDYVKVNMEDYGVASNKIILAKNEYFVLGDNRNESLDSRTKDIGNIKEERIIGKVPDSFEK